MSIRFKLTALLIMVSMLPLLVLTVQQLYSTNAQVAKDILARNEFNTYAVEKDIKTLIELPMNGIRQLAQNPVVKTFDPVQIKPVLTEALRIYPDVSLLAVDNALGRQVVRSNNAPLSNVSRRYFYTEAMQGRKEVVSEVITSQADQRLIVVLATPIFDQGKIVGAVQASVDLKRLREFVSSRTQQNYKVYVVGSDGKLLAHPDYTFSRESDRLALGQYRYVQAGLRGQNQRLRVRNFENREVLLSERRNANTGWLICSETSSAEVINQNNQHLMGVLLLTLILIGSIIVLSFNMAGRIARPITLLQATAERIAEGNLVAEKIAVHSNDEIGRLAVSFQKMVDYLFNYAFFDNSTGLHNRKYFWNTLEQVFQSEAEERKNGAVIFLDLDNFKTINDSFGHSFGDLILKEIGRRLTERFPECLVAKFGGDEFGFLLEEVEDVETLTYLAQAIINLIQEPVHIKGQELLLTASVGVALYPQDGSNLEELLKNADIAMYKAKENGRNGFEFFSERLSRDSLEKMNLEIDLRKAVANQEFVTYYQPQYKVIPTGNPGETRSELIGFEALVRWNSPKYGILSPGVFVDLAERTGIISDIGKQVFRQACVFAREINQDGVAPICVSINISPIQLMQSDFLATYHEIMQETGVDPKMLGIEITESTMINFFETNNQKIKFWKDAGLKVSLDDFGTGYSSLNYLRKLPVSMIKIDKSFVDDIVKDEKYFKLTEAIINIAHDLELEVIAEGVELSEQLDLLLLLNCDYIQGYLLGKPAPEAEACQLVIKRRGLRKIVG